MKKRNVLRIALTFVTLWIWVVRSAHAGPPFVTDDPEPVELHHWELYIASEHFKVPGDWSGTAPHFELNYGAAPDLQLHMIAPLAYDDPAAGAAHYGFADLELGAKYRFIHETNGWPQVGIFPLLQVPTSGNAANNLGNPPGHWQAFLPLWIQKSWGKWTAYGGGGYGINSFSGNDNWGFAGVVLQRQVLTNLLIGAEIYHQTDLQIDFPNKGTAFNIGTVYDVNEHNHLLFSAGRSISGPTAFQCYIAWQFTFDNKDLLHFWRPSGHKEEL